MIRQNVPEPMSGQHVLGLIFMTGMKKPALGRAVEEWSILQKPLISKEAMTWR
ncbi:hypothetical protein [Phytopseudomonas seleniipraecipitans]|uniref:Uncharacterized protein n=1 Tax=Phytopseudomonas seleniipraecipitans TaxID=640205 RepID=A0A1G7JB79_9GAMM|nr:hypothetical protein [Pseudomonas seleniipraecipitans]SDF22143.1 hypothetical protein SAMN05216381_1053 [Pseudomonas seleniipraecipitans]